MNTQQTMQYLEFIMTAVVGAVLVIMLLLCYVYVFRQLCCPPGRHRRHHKHGSRDAQPMGRSTRVESLPLTNVTSQLTETDKV